jgi:hypothetical protein
MVARHEHTQLGGGASPEEGDETPVTEEALARALALAQQRQADQQQRRAASRPSAPPRSTPAPAPKADPAVSMDEPCPCGSGEPFRKCHGEFLDDAPGA